MRQRVFIRPRADRDLDKSADFIARDSLNAARRFYNSAAQTFLFLADNPELGSLCEFDIPQLAGLRVWPIQGFKNTWSSIVAFLTESK
jgi:toxin ParE1/3/4